MSIKLPRVRAQKIKSKKKRSQASARWLLRQINDPYCHAARRDAYRSRAAYKLIEINEKMPFLKGGLSVIDLGSAPGSWTQVIQQKVPQGFILAIDRLNMLPLDGIHFLKADFLTEEERVAQQIAQLHPEPFDVVLSDMAPEATGNQRVDHLRIMVLCEQAVDFALKYLKRGGHFLTKVWQGGMQGSLLALLKENFSSVAHIKPQASRAASSEQYVLARDKKYD